MKAEINKENKTKFFAVYWAQYVKSSDNHLSKQLKPLEINAHSIQHVYEKSFLILKPLSKITDEDAEFIDLKNEDYNEQGWFSADGSFYFWAFDEADYLRSKGYAIPWMGLSVEEMVKAGWIKLT